MSVRITSRFDVALYDSVTGIAFGPILAGSPEATDFLEWLPLDARTYEAAALIEMKHRWETTVRDGDKTDKEIYG